MKGAVFCVQMNRHDDRFYVLINCLKILCAISARCSGEYKMKQAKCTYGIFCP